MPIVPPKVAKNVPEEQTPKEGQADTKSPQKAAPKVAKHAQKEQTHNVGQIDTKSPQKGMPKVEKHAEKGTAFENDPVVVMAPEKRAAQIKRHMLATSYKLGEKAPQAEAAQAEASQASEDSIASSVEAKQPIESNKPVITSKWKSHEYTQAPSSKDPAEDPPDVQEIKDRFRKHHKIKEPMLDEKAQVARDKEVAQRMLKEAESKVKEAESKTKEAEHRKKHEDKDDDNDDDKDKDDKEKDGEDDEKKDKKHKDKDKGKKDKDKEESNDDEQDGDTENLDEASDRFQKLKDAVDKIEEELSPSSGTAARVTKEAVISGKFDGVDTDWLTLDQKHDMEQGCTDSIIEFLHDKKHIGLNRDKVSCKLSRADGLRVAIQLTDDEFQNSYKDAAKAITSKHFASKLLKDLVVSPGGRMSIGKLASLKDVTMSESDVTMASNIRNQIAKGFDASTRAISARSKGSCFPADATVISPTGPRKMSELQLGDEVLAFNSATASVEFTRIRAWLHRSTNSMTSFTRLHTEEGDIVASPMHSLAVGASPGSYAFAQDIAPGATLITPNGTVAVRASSTQMSKGLYTPLTFTSNFYVSSGNQEGASSNFLAHSFSEWSRPERVERLIHFLFTVAEYFYPSIHDISEVADYVHPVGRLLGWTAGVGFHDRTAK
eukprot:gnl/TRDRNA2_/TRDRNA2_174160_c0_seq11.p1 gnl/TRDRNA2_/TRDRNA2_174160_c0~~gnl/TRDRNA2_/TRDRNA2_174160_c0_seq11.p1  ORF type:complete len:662 (-),score=169.28 gnl/TRDRNA2_/TRDRNA2_174160_c0_seq11:74-2059(-)